VRQKPVEAGADQHDDVGVFQYGRARRTRRLRMCVRQEAFRHAHRQEGDAGLFDQGADLLVDLCICCALAENDQRALGTLQQIERARDGGGSWTLGGCRVDDLDE